MKNKFALASILFVSVLGLGLRSYAIDKKFYLCGKFKIPGGYINIINDSEFSEMVEKSIGKDNILKFKKIEKGALKNGVTYKWTYEQNGKEFIFGFEEVN